LKQKQPYIKLLTLSGGNIGMNDVPNQQIEEVFTIEPNLPIFCQALLTQWLSE
jgi:hypothetical protein